MTALKNIRTACGYSQSQLAAASGVSVRIIQHYEQEYRDINLAEAATIYKLSRVLGCSMEDILDTGKIEIKPT